MSEERRISLAELLARDGDTPPPPAGGRRRRHRGGENSITVAELTGEIPVVRDDTPPPDAVDAAEQAAPVEQAAQEAPQRPAAPVQPAAYQQVADTVEPQPEAAAPAAPAVEPDPAPQQEQDDEPVTSSFLAAAVADAGASAAPAQPEPEASAADEAADGAQAPAPRRGLFRRGRGAQAPAASQEPEATPQADDFAAPAESADAADVAPAQAAQSQQDQDFAWSRWDQADAPIMATADFNTAQVRERQSRFAEVESEDTVDVKPVPGPDPDVREAAAVPATPDTAALSAQRFDDGPAGSTTPDFLTKPGDAEDTDEDSDEQVEPKGKGRGWLALVAEVVLGLVAGAGLFFGFFKLWNWGGGWPTIALTVVLAFIVIIGIVTFTHYLRKTTDYLTLGLALFVGLVITFGPLLMALGSS
ncbi:hypothetical protein FK529_03815 [Tsukamurella asaccharolytica]|uniref:Uncharacterized protein n=1 Tax=Tsukamurella asaccharolytica TaxID=2592067 RepID=A0A5C5RCW8_9ACTN|nr:hypothetical protein [Tsukamurella asaccharolytica]TWS20482.1 hypothetical protein FK529_03815 [Tsukamurella asaccharolytica]